MKKTGTVSLLLLAIAFAGPSLAHHSAAQYDRTAMKIVSGEVTEYAWVNPHTWVYLRVTGEDGNPQEWAMEGESVGQYVRIGWTAESVKVGDVVEAHVWPLKDGSYGGQLGFLILEDGTVLGEVPEGFEPPGYVHP
jgi:hypothetical protein